MKTNPAKSITSGFSLLTISVLLIVSFSIEVSAKRGCSAFGHSCFGGHGKRSNPIGETPLKEFGTYSGNANGVMANLYDNKIQQLRHFMKCQNCAVESSRRVRNDQTYIPLLLEKLYASYRRLHNTDLASNNA